MMKTLVTRSFKMSPDEQAFLQSLGVEITILNNEAEPVAEPEQYEAIIAFRPFDATPLSAFSNLKYLQLTSAGMDHLPLDEIKRRGIVLNNARGVYSVPMAEFALCGVLQIYKKARQFAAQQAEHKWQRLRGVQDIAGKSVVIVGVGSIGNEMAKRFAAFDARVIGVNRSAVTSPYFDEIVQTDKLDEVLAQADIVVLSLPLTPSTRGMFDAGRLARIKQGAVLVNVARGPIVDQQALQQTLASGHLQGAVLDVFEEEPLPADSPLWDMPHVLVTPHNSFFSESNNASMFRVVARNLQEYLAKK